MQTKTADQVWFITGISRGLGRHLASAVLGEGGTVIGTTRDGQSNLAAAGHGQLHVLTLEVTDADQTRRVVAQAQALHGRLDVVVNNAGYGLLGAIEEASDEESRHVMEVNFFGPLAVVRAALPFLRAQRGGHIVNISSIAGLAPGAGSGLYAAAKFALEGMSQSLAQELAPLGIKVTLVEPGVFRTDFLNAGSLRRTTGAAIADYASTSGATIEHLDKIAGQQLGDPAKGAAAILEAARSDHPPLHLLLGSDAVQRARAKIDRFNADLSDWEAVSLSTDFDTLNSPV